MHFYLTSAALILACLGFIWAILRIQQVNRLIAGAWPDWEGIRSASPLWVLFALATSTGLAGVGLAFQSGLPSLAGPSSGSNTTEVETLNAEIAQLKNLLSEATAPAMHSNQPTSTESEPKTNDATESDPETPADQATPQIPLPEIPATTPETKTVAPQIEALSRAVISAVISGSMKPLEPVANQSLIDQFTINPFNFSRLQIGLKARLAEGYTPTYLDALQSPSGVTYIWKIQTKSDGPDILERLAVTDGKVTAFRFDGIQ